MTERALALRPGPRGAWASLVGLAVRATLLRPGHAAARDASGFPPAALVGAPATAASDPLRMVALPGVLAPLALVRWPAAPGDDAELIAVELAGGGVRAAIALVAAVAAVTRRAGASRLRWASWSGPGAAHVDRATAILGFEPH